MCDKYDIVIELREQMHGEFSVLCNVIVEMSMYMTCKVTGKHTYDSWFNSITETKVNI